MNDSKRLTDSVSTRLALYLWTRLYTSYQV